MKPLGFTIRTKVLIAMVAGPTAALSLFLFVAVKTFKSDKIAYIFDSSASLSRAIAGRFAGEIDRYETLAAAMLTSATPDGLSPNGQALLEHDPRVRSVQIYSADAPGEIPKLLFTAQNRSLSGAASVGGAADSAPASDDLAATRAAAALLAAKTTVHADDGFLTVTLPLNGEAEKKFLVVLRLDGADMRKTFRAEGPQKFFIVDEGGEIVFSNLDRDDHTAQEILGGPFANTLRMNRSGVEFPSFGKRSALVAYDDVGKGGLKVVAVVDGGAAMSAVGPLLERVLTFYSILFFLVIAFGVFASKTLTSAISRLNRAALQISKGDFTARVHSSSNDEVGSLAKSFNVMATEVARLIVETATKARMAAELDTAKTVQETLFPLSTADYGAVEISGYYEPASECCGDWWHHFDDGQYIYLWIGDVTGHGVPAALMTSAARAAVAVIQKTAGLSPAEGLTALNQALYETSKGTMLATFFLARLRKADGELVYSNASHEPPLLFRASALPVDARSCVLLQENNSPPLGSFASRVFQESSLQLAPGDRIVLFTDGLTDIKDPAGKALGHRRFSKSLAASMSSAGDAKSVVTAAVTDINTWRAGEVIDDDVTLAVLRFVGPAKSNVAVA